MTQSSRQMVQLTNSIRGSLGPEKCSDVVKQSRSLMFLLSHLPHLSQLDASFFPPRGVHSQRSASIRCLQCRHLVGQHLDPFIALQEVGGPQVCPQSGKRVVFRPMMMDEGLRSISRWRYRRSTITLIDQDIQRKRAWVQAYLFSPKEARMPMRFLPQEVASREL